MSFVFLHAFPLDSSMWEPQLFEFRDRFRVVAPNFPGFGDSLPVDGAASIEAAAERAHDEMRAAGIERPVLVGLSMGGYVALAFWRRHPQLVSGLVLANTRAEADDQAGKERRYALAERLQKEGSGFLVDNPPALLSPNAPGELDTLVKGIISRQRPEAIAAASRAMATRLDMRGDLPAINVPVLVITGSEDTLIPPEASKQMADAIPDARFEVIEGAGHLTNLEAPERFNELLREHLGRAVDAR